MLLFFDFKFKYLFLSFKIILKYNFILFQNNIKTITAEFLVLPPISCIVIDFGDPFSLNSNNLKSFGMESVCRKEYESAFYSGPIDNPLDMYHNYT